MSFETIIIILQTIGPFTVLVTVYFLVTELKEQNRVARANARQNIADSHQKLTLAGLEKRRGTYRRRGCSLLNSLHGYSESKTKPALSIHNWYA